MTRRFLLLVSVVLLAGALQARELTLSQAIELAQQHSFTLKRAHATHEAATADLQAARAERFPTLSANGNASYISDIPKLNIQLPVGPPLTREIGTDQNYQLDLRATLPLYTGSRISSSIDIATAARELNAAMEAADSNRVIYQARLEYLGLYRADQMVQVAKASQDRAAAISKNISSLYEAGAADSVALLDAQLAESRAALGVSQAETNRRIAEIRLITILGLDIADRLTLADKPVEPTAPDARLVLQTTKPELRAAEASVAVSRARTSLAHADYLPTVAAFGGYSYGKPNLDRFGNTWNDYFTAGATLTWSFNLGGRTANRAHSAKWGLEATRNDRDNILENTIRENNLAYEQLRLAFVRYQNAKMEFRITSDNYRLAQIQHSEGTLSSNRLLEIEADLTGAQASLAASVVDYALAQSAYYYANGSDNLKKGI